MILARNKRRPIERERHMAVIRPWTEVSCAGKLPLARHLITVENHHHKPVTVVDVAVRQHAAKIGVWHLTRCKLLLGEDKLNVR